MRVDKSTLKDPLFQLLSNENKQRYVNIANERKNIYLKGFGLGFVISLLALIGMLNDGPHLIELSPVDSLDGEPIPEAIKYINIIIYLITIFFSYILHPFEM